MILLKFEKTENFAYISHVDMLRHFQRTFRRANINVEFSNGFNSHMLIYFSAPLPLGLTSKAEYCCVASDMDAKEFLERYNSNCPLGLIGLSANRVDKNPNLQANVFACKYDFGEPLKSKDSYIVSYLKKGEMVTEDVTNKVIKVEGNYAILKGGNDNLRPDRFNQEINITKIVKTNQYLKEGEKLIDVDEIFQLK